MICFQGKIKKKRINYVSVLVIFFSMKGNFFFEGIKYKVFKRSLKKNVETWRNDPFFASFRQVLFRLYNVFCLSSLE
jgi:hypothetical protein